MKFLRYIIDKSFSFYKTVYRLRRSNDQLAQRIFDQAFICIILLILCITGLLLSQAGMVQFLMEFVSPSLLKETT